MSSLEVRREQGAAWLTLNRPEALNALDGPTKDALVDALRAAAEDDAVRAVALTGAGRAFCVGQDLRELEGSYRAGRTPDLASALERHYAPACRLLAEMPKPTVAVLNGVAAGAGVSLAAACDLRLASSAARFRLAFAGIALIPDAGSTWHLPRLLGLSRALELALLGDWVEADQALQWGLVNRVWPAEAFAEQAAAAVAALAAGPTQAFARTRALYREHLAVDLPTALAGEAKAQVAAAQTDDHLEGVTAFLEKRPPRFQGA
ncbi:MAG TPA: enoyl-CoA hydratase-related protein [Actinomycetes bacterium]|jgi:2-(1,2-epoxy-1,2-dihydrophenyl)acetyl-CoA isomerase|nr:enoyl-CoA hydratase-related protein [Actinomycetes bacterium]